MRERERKKLAEEIVGAFISFTNWYGKPFKELLYEDLSDSGKVCKITITGENTVRYVLSNQLDGYISIGRGHKRMSIEEWSRLLGVWFRIQDSFKDIIDIRWLRSEGLIVVNCKGVHEGIDIDEAGKIVSVMEVYDE